MDLDTSNDVLGMDVVEMVNTPIDDLETESVDLICLVLDKSGSMSRFQHVMKDCLDRLRIALVGSKAADEILLSKTLFDSDVIALSGYKPLKEFSADYSVGSVTALYDAIILTADNHLRYSEFLRSEGMNVKAVFLVLTDGMDNASRASFQEARAKVEELNAAEVTTAFICFAATADLRQQLNTTAANLQFRNIADASADESSLRLIMDQVSASVISHSTSVVNDPNNFFSFSSKV